MKVMQINVVFDHGSTGKIMCDIHTELVKNGIESVICYGRGAKTKDRNVYKVSGELYSKFNNLLSRFTGLMYGGCFFSTIKLIRIIKSEKPDIVHLHCLNGYFVNIYRLISWLNENKIKTILTLHAEFMHTANCAHAFDCEKWLSGCGNCPRLRKATKSLFLDGTHRSWVKMKKAFYGFKDLTVVSVSPWLQSRAEKSPVLSGHEHKTILNGLDVDIFHHYSTKNLRNELRLTDEKVIFHATPWFCDDEDHIKGGYYILKLAAMLKEKNVKIVVAGAFDENIDVPDNVILLGRISDQTFLARYYSLADVTVIASKKETFSMIVAESLCCGTPVVGFFAGGPEKIALDEYSKFVEYGDIEKLTDATMDMVARCTKSEEISKKALEKYSKKIMAQEYLCAYRKFGV